jgi:hypothetical protein
MVSSSLVEMFMKNGQFGSQRRDHYVISKGLTSLSEAAPHPKRTKTKNEGFQMLKMLSTSVNSLIRACIFPTKTIKKEKVIYRAVQY